MNLTTDNEGPLVKSQTLKLFAINIFSLSYPNLTESERERRQKSPQRLMNVNLITQSMYNKKTNRHCKMKSTGQQILVNIYFSVQASYILIGTRPHISTLLFVSICVI